MGKFRDKLYRFMYGRYGVDELYNFLSILVIVLLACDLVLGLFIGGTVPGTIVLFVFSTLNFLIVIWAVCRCFSKKIEKRRRENQRYLRVRGAVKRFFCANTSKKSKRGPKDSEVYIYRDCTKCGNTLRLPYKAGKNAVKCPRCSHRFFVKAKKLKNKK